MAPGIKGPDPRREAGRPWPGCRWYGHGSAVRSHGRIRLTCCRGDTLVTGIIRPLI